jgi:hypothetical protein
MISQSGFQDTPYHENRKALKVHAGKTASLRVRAMMEK